MAWHDYGLIFKVNNLADWIVSHAYVPTAIALDDRIRVFVAFLDAYKFGRLGFVDVDLNDPTIVVGHSIKPLLSDSNGEAFDNSGVTPLCVLDDGDHIKLYYAGWKTYANENKRYELFTGLAIGDRHAGFFKRYSDRPILAGRSSDEAVRTGGQVLKTDSGYLCFLSTQKGVRTLNDKLVPIYDMELARSQDGQVWDDEQSKIFGHVQGQILGYGRSAVWQNDVNQYEGLFSVRGWNGKYTNLMYSKSLDGLSWDPLSDAGKAFLAMQTRDGQTEVAFPSVIRSGCRIFMFYNGDGFGVHGLRLAVWSS